MCCGVAHRGFDLPLPTQHHIDSPYAYRSGLDDDALIATSVAALRAKVAELGADNVAAFFCEPIQGSGGVIVPPRGWLKAMADTARELDILFVVDEVITGFGRTGPMYACDAEGIADGAPAGQPIGHGATRHWIYGCRAFAGPKCVQSALGDPLLARAPEMRITSRSSRGAGSGLLVQRTGVD